MTELLFALRIVSALGWVIVMAVTFASACRAFTSRARHHDLIWALFFGLALNRLWFVSRGLLFEPNTPTELPEQILVVSSYIFGLLLSALEVRAFYWYREART